MIKLPDTNLCRYCGKKPRIVTVFGSLYYAQCKCNKWNPYEFVGTTPVKAINNWNTFNTKKDETHD